MDGDRYFLNNTIKLKYATVVTLKNMNNSFITKADDFDYRFLVYLLNDVFEKETLAISSVYVKKTKTHKFSELNQEKLGFVQGKLVIKDENIFFVLIYSIFLYHQNCSKSVLAQASGFGRFQSISIKDAKFCDKIKKKELTQMNVNYHKKSYLLHWSVYLYINIQTFKPLSFTKESQKIQKKIIPH